MVARGGSGGRRLVAGACAVLLAASCSAGDKPTASSSRPANPPGNAASPSPAADPCPSAYLPPDPDRPRISVDFRIDAAHKQVAGVERVVFMPDLPVTELVFRLWANVPGAPKGTAMAVTAARSGSAGAFVIEPAGGKPGTPGTLLRLPLGRTVPAGEAVTATVDFTLDLGVADFERWGSTGKTAWWGSGHPLLAWQRGVGWRTDPAADVLGEYAVSETARYEITVDAPAGDTVLISAPTDLPVAAGTGRRRWHASNLFARDVSVAVGTFAQRTGMVEGVPLTVGVSSDTHASPDTLLVETARGVRALVHLLGPFPFASLTVVALPTLSSGGIEYPGGFFVGPRLSRVTITHESAHQWFYGLVGDNQARDPWLDEAFATYAEEVADGTVDASAEPVTNPGRVGAPMSSFEANRRDYFTVVYHKGAAALAAARRDVGAPAFDAAIRCYINANGWRVAVPADVVKALATLPKAADRLRAAGAF